MPVATTFEVSNDQLAFGLALQSSLVPYNALGDATSSFTRATTATVWGYGPTAVIADGPTLLTVNSGEARFVGARRISANNWSVNDANGVFISTTNGASSLYGDASGPLGFFVEGVRTNYLLQSGTPATQTTASLTTGTYTLWQTGTGSSTSSAGTATITGGGAATEGSPNVFVVTVAGTVVVTVAGSPTTFQLEKGATASSYIPTTTTALQRNTDVLTYASLGNSDNTVGSFTAEVFNPVSGSFIFALDQVQTAGAYQNSGQLLMTDGTNNVNRAGISAVAVTKIGGSWGPAGMLSAVNGVVTSGSFDGTFGTNAQINIAGPLPIFGTIRNVRIWNKALSASKLASLTS